MAKPPEDSELAPLGIPDPDLGQKRIIWSVVALAVVALALFRFAPRIRAPFLPVPVAAYVAVLPEGGSVARDGRHELAAGTVFQLHAVLEARTVTGATVYFTEAPALRLGETDIPGERLRRWPAGERTARVRWWTVEGFAPYLAVAADEPIERFHYVETFHPEWGPGWTAAGVIDPRLVQLEATSPLRPLPFGTQRYAVRVEIYETSSVLTAGQRMASAGGEELLESPARVTTVVAALPAALARVSRAFGLPQIDPREELPEEVARRIEAWHSGEVAFERSALLREHLEAAGLEPADLAWRRIDLAVERPAWGGRADGPGPAVAAGDLIQGGGRIVVLFRDAGEPEQLDAADLVFDLHRGAKIRRLDEVFAEAGESELEWAAVGASKRPAA